MSKTQRQILSDIIKGDASYPGIWDDIEMLEQHGVPFLYIRSALTELANGNAEEWTMALYHLEFYSGFAMEFKPYVK